MKTSKIAIYKPKVLLIKRVRKLIPILIIVVLLSASFSPAILAKKGIKDSSQVHRIKTLTNDNHADKPVKTMFVKLAERLVERFPKLASLPIFQRILNDNNSSLGDTSSSDDSDKGFMDKFLDNHPKIKSTPIFQRFLDDEEQSNSGETPTNNRYYIGGSGGNNNGSTVFESGDISSLGDVNGTDNSTKYVIPEAGHLQISGNVSMEIANGMFYIQNHTVLLSGKFYLESEDDSVDIWWNLTQGFFKINGSRHFEIEDLYFDVDGKLIVNINSMIIIDGQGYFT
ncbi:MAG TPA: hypothetical protein ENL13_04805, partial [Thermoplasmatales archaeon]|nr:hypothetical protein [Thermoplasmatales archaeon]